MKRKIILLSGRLVVLFMASWIMVYPGDTSPRSLAYLLWKLGLPSLKTESVYGVMSVDPGVDALVVGKTEEQLARRFGRLSSSDAELTSYQKHCKKHLPYKNVRFLGDSWWLVVFDDHNVATRLVLCKGVWRRSATAGEGQCLARG